jgi:hypothetical protein
VLLSSRFPRSLSTQGSVFVSANPGRKLKCGSSFSNNDDPYHHHHPDNNDHHFGTDGGWDQTSCKSFVLVVVVSVGRPAAGVGGRWFGHPGPIIIPAVTFFSNRYGAVVMARKNATGGRFERGVKLSTDKLLLVADPLNERKPIFLVFLFLRNRHYQRRQYSFADSVQDVLPLIGRRLMPMGRL